jgi:hypothetical protein
VREPQSDSITDQPKAMIRGDVQLISQIDFFIDDTYNNTLALGPQDTTFVSGISLSPGTHTLKAVATDSCSNTTHTESVVITYEPAIQPSVGQNIATQVEDQQTSGLENRETIEPAKSIAEKAFDNIIVLPIIALGKSLDIVSLPAASGELQWQNSARSLSFVIGSGLVLTAGYVSLMGSVPAHMSFLPFSRRQIIGGGAIIGAAMLALVFIL